MLRPCHSSQGHSTARPSRDGRAVALRRMAWSEHGMASVNQTRPLCLNQMGKTHAKPLAARHGRGTAWARHAMCESAFRNWDTSFFFSVHDITQADFISFFLGFRLFSGKLSKQSSWGYKQEHQCHDTSLCIPWTLICETVSIRSEMTSGESVWIVPSNKSLETWARQGQEIGLSLCEPATGVVFLTE